MSKGFIPPKFIAPAPASLPPRKPKGRFSPITIALAVTLIVACAAMATFFILQHNPDNLHPTAQNSTATNPSPAATTSSAPAPILKITPPVVPLADAPETTAEVQKFFAEFIAGIRANDGDALTKLFDGARTIDILHDMGLLSHTGPQERAYAGAQYSDRYARILVKAKELIFDEIAVFKILPLPNPNEVLVVTHNRVLKPTGRSKSLWWLRKSSGSWRIYDSEDIEISARQSHTFATMRTVHEAPGEAPLPWTKYCKDFDSYRHAVFRMERPQKIGTGDFDLTTFPRPLQADMLFIQGENEWMQNRPVKALQFYDQAEAMGADTPRLHKARALAYHMNNQFELAIASANRFMDIVGDDALTCAFVASACEKLGRKSDAIQAYQRGLRDDPDHKRIKDELRRLQAP